MYIHIYIPLATARGSFPEDGRELLLLVLLVIVHPPPTTSTPTPTATAKLIRFGDAPLAAAAGSFPRRRSRAACVRARGPRDAGRRPCWRRSQERIQLNG